jgi:hypothetical protein
MCFPIMHPKKVSFNEIDFLWDVVCVFSECFVQTLHSTVGLLTVSDDASRSNEGLYDER